MKLDLDHYIFRQKKVFTRKFCKQTIDELRSYPWEKHQFKLYTGKEEVEDRAPSGEYEPDCCFPGGGINDYIIKKLKPVILAYVDRLDFHWWKGWSGYSPIKVNRYTKKTRMFEHCDHIHTLFEGDRKGVPTLSIIGMLNDDCEGGDLVFFQNKKNVLSAGEVVIFPSNFLYPHKVTPIKKGCRVTFVSWVW